MRKGTKLAALGAVCAAIAGVLAYKKYQDSYTELTEDEFENTSDFAVPDEVFSDIDFEVDEQIMFYE